MDDRTQETALSLTKFGIGQPVLRTEDPKLVRGQGRYTDDVNLPGQAYAVMVRSRDAHGIIRVDRHRRRQGDAGRARGLYRRDLKAYGTLKCPLPLKSRDGSPITLDSRGRRWPTDKVRFVGDPVACVVAETRGAGQGRGRSGRARHRALAGGDRAPARRRSPARRTIYDEVPGNIALDYHYGDTAKVAAAFARRPT